MTTRFHDEYAGLHRETEQEKEKLYVDIKHARGEWKHEQEEYTYKTHIERRKEEDEYALKVRDKERQFIEKYTAKEKEFSEREQKLKIQEEEMRELQVRVQAFPKELEKAVRDAEERVRKEMEQRAKVATDLSAKDTQREHEVAELKIHNLEDIVKLRSTNIIALEKQLAQANEQIQKLAVTVVESGSNIVSKRNFQDQEKQEPKTM
ncbi:MAG: hypothetical protein G01um101448_522 [Parcubacteria group bacterium Gr01-1014_48]|nr:MAG: hypothetical protein Greene041614_182 [Parcubacteria group bacterium Greene0416_14]TSC73833.1 MAG: hypothetical protein G01um101448_522 [Parcubacteria group bacterium Gr01-1014_48]TSD01214.1 MAG: hypothetical protein Greene101415_409 [Parcubacteria group bacterium Greene1014_15]TSD07310.1 MAG: hypothetical protein Greene07144_943 [Parcubacteria group bacterium Greene0714_4]